MRNYVRVVRMPLLHRHWDEAELLIELLTSRAVLLQCGPDPLNDVQGLSSRIMVLLEKAALYLCYQGGGVLLSVPCFH